MTEVDTAGESVAVEEERDWTIGFDPIDNEWVVAIYDDAAGTIKHVFDQESGDHWWTARMWVPVGVAENKELPIGKFDGILDAARAIHELYDRIEE